MTLLVFRRCFLVGLPLALILPLFNPVAALAAAALAAAATLAALSESLDKRSTQAWLRSGGLFEKCLLLSKSL